MVIFRAKGIYSVNGINDLYKEKKTYFDAGETSLKTSRFFSTGAFLNNFSFYLYGDEQGGGLRVACTKTGWLLQLLLRSIRDLAGNVNFLSFHPISSSTCLLWSFALHSLVHVNKSFKWNK